MKKYNLDGIDILIYDNGKFVIDDEGIFGDYKPQTFYESTRANLSIVIDGHTPLILTEDGFAFNGAEQYGNSLYLKYSHTDEGIAVTIKLENVADVIVQQNTITNISNKEINLTGLSSAFLEYVGYSENMPWYKKDIKISLCHSKWQGEGQWRSYTPSDLGLYPSTDGEWESEFYRFGTTGSWSTNDFYPIVIAEDKTDGKTWFMETEGAHSWQIKLACYGGYKTSKLAMEASSCEETVGNWHYVLKPGREYITERAFYGVVEGGFEEAVKALNNFKRADSVFDCKNIPLVFNDYMDCLWNTQTPELVLPLVDAAAEAGCEYFCIDGGWSCNKAGDGLGDWIPNPKNYKEKDLKYIADRIKEKGMIPGIWFEFDACFDSAELIAEDINNVLCRYGKPVGIPNRHFYNFKSKRVCDYLTERVKAVYDMGYCYIKNDYNLSTGAGCTNNYDGDSPAEGLIKNTNVFYAFIDSLYKKFPGLVMENCGSGALREDNKTLRRFSLQSTSDQEMYLNNPSIAMGSEAIIPPEKAGLWAYPYPANGEVREKFKLTEEYVKEREDGKETAFNIVTGLVGAMYLSGRIDLCDEKNFALVKKGTEIFKEIRQYIPQSCPIYPTGMHRMNAEEIASLGLLSENRIMLAVWNTASEEKEARIDLSKYADKLTVKRTYAHNDPEFNVSETTLGVKLEGKSAVWFEFII